MFKYWFGSKLNENSDRFSYYESVLFVYRILLKL